MYTIYTTSGATAAVLKDRNIYNLQGEWIGWADEANGVYSISGEYVGWLTREARVLRKRTHAMQVSRRSPPPHPGRFRVPASLPLPPLMSDISFDTVDVMDEMPELLHTADFDQRAEDLN